MKRFFSCLLSLLFPNRCPVCHGILPHREHLCKACYNRMLLLENPVRQEGAELIDLSYSLYPYRHPFTKSILFSMKDLGYKNSIAFAAERMAEFVKEDAYLKNTTVITHAPRRPGEKLRLGFDQAELLAKELSARLSIPHVAALRRNPGGRRQRGSVGEARQQNVKGRFVPAPSCELSGNIVLLIDDVITTGATVQECTSVLKLKMGAYKVYAFSFTSPALKTEEE